MTQTQVALGLMGLAFVMMLAKPVDGQRGLRLRTWWRLVREYGKLKEVYEMHRNDGFFEYGEPCKYEDLGSHPGFLELVGLRNAEILGTSGATVNFKRDFPILPTYLPIEEGAAACLGALGLAAADLLQVRNGQNDVVVTVKQSDAGLSTAGYMFLEVEPEDDYEGLDGFAATIAQEGTVNPTRRAYQCGDGSFVFLHGGFPKLKRGILDFFRIDGTPTVEAIAKAAAQYKSGVDLEAVMQGRGLAVTKCRTPKEWRESDQGKAVGALKPISFQNTPPKNNNKGARVLKPSVRPLSDVIVVEFSHVIASPMVGRTLAEHGATVFKIFTAKRPRRKLFDEETNNGKIPLHLDLDTAEDRNRLWDLLKVADVLIDGYTAGVLAAKGFDVEDLASKCPDLIYLRISCYGHVGPWASHKGFQQNANFATGIATVDDEALLCYQLTSQVDYTTGFLGAMGVMIALTERQRKAQRGEPASLSMVRTSLCQAAMWMSKFGARMPNFFDFTSRISRLLFSLNDRMCHDGNLKYLPPALSMSRGNPARVKPMDRWWA